uniref:protein unc-93 homolog A-like n=1 Tax=Styela clava TaxID=7725 RepID=UPI0019394C81|nr:protein unc-93 homolog A-like [Styela clava]
MRQKSYLFLLGVLLVFSPYVAMVVLQSSINVQGGLGLYSLGLAYGTSVLFTLLVNPVIIRRFGSKRALLAGEVTYIIYFLANFFPESYTLLPAGIIVGAGEALTWTVFVMYSLQFGQQIAKLLSKQEHQYAEKYSGRFVATFQLSQILGNLISYAILYGGKNHSGNYLPNNTTTNSSVKMVTSDFRYCGANDCQNANLTREALDQYKPQDPHTMYILISVMIFVSICGIVTHSLILPSGELSNLTITKVNPEGKEENIFIAEKDHLKDKNRVESPNAEQLAKNGCQLVLNTFKTTFNHVCSKYQLLITPLTICYGFHVSFIMGELTRAYTSCILGVEQVGFTVAIFAAVDGTVALACKKIVQLFGRNRIILVALVQDLAVYTFCVFWNPQINTTWVVYLIFLMFGATDGIWKTMLIVIYQDYFPKCQEIAFSAWNMWITIGITLQFLFSTMICVYTKIYIKMSLFLLGVLLYGVAEYIRKKERVAGKINKATGPVASEMREISPLNENQSSI